MDLTLQSAFLAEMSTLLILLAGAVLLYSSFRERYQVPWIAGWALFTLSKVFLTFGIGHTPDRIWGALCYAAFISAVGLFATSIFLYTAQKKLLWPSLLVLAGALPLGLFSLESRSYPWLLTLGLGLCWLVRIVASVQLVRFAWGRRTVGRWLLALTILLLHFDLAETVHTVVGYDILVDLLLGIGMMTIVLEDSRLQIQRLDALNNITHQISDSRDFQSTVAMILEELKQLTRAKAAWFRLLQGDKLVLAAQCGLSDVFVQKLATVETASSVSSFALREGEVYVLKAAESSPGFRQVIAAEKIHHLLLVPVEGKSSSVGMFVLGMPHFRAYTGREKTFLKAAAKQIGLAAENRTLMQQLVQSRNEWASTFESIPDFVLVHDLDYRVLRANGALLARLGRSRDEVVQHLCEEVLPGAGVSWQGCPYCAHADCAGEEDPCFGGYSVVSTSAYTVRRAFPRRDRSRD